VSGIHPRFADCSLVAIEFRPGEPTMVRMTKGGGELLVVANAALVGDTLREVQRLERIALRVPPLRVVR
jgi:hypothetical protein